MGTKTPGNSPATPKNALIVAANGSGNPDSAPHKTVPAANGGTYGMKLDSGG